VYKGSIDASCYAFRLPARNPSLNFIGNLAEMSSSAERTIRQPLLFG
jgi:hypothetical protein